MIKYNAILNENCKLVSNKLEQFYIYKYNPKPILEQYIKELKQDIAVEKMYYDLEESDNCCNCISYSIYSKGEDPNKLANQIGSYFLSINRSIKNIKNNLPYWIVRIYIDNSIYNAINIICKNRPYCEISQLYDEIKNSGIVEIYTYNCQSITGSDATKNPDL
jgi:hypothetical protein